MAIVAATAARGIFVKNEVINVQEHNFFLFSPLTLDNFFQRTLGLSERKKPFFLRFECCVTLRICNILWYFFRKVLFHFQLQQNSNTSHTVCDFERKQEEAMEKERKDSFFNFIVVHLTLMNYFEW